MTDMADKGTFAERYLTALVVDIEGFNRDARDDAIRLRLLAALHDILFRALDAAGIPRAHCPIVDSTGDGWLIVVDETVSRVRLLNTIRTHLLWGLQAHNRLASGQAELRVRVVMHAGEMLLTEGAVVGEQLNLAFRLLESDALHRHLKATGASMVLCISDHLYQQVVCQRHHGCDPADFSAMDVAVKETSTRGWVMCLGRRQEGVDQGGQHRM